MERNPTAWTRREKGAFRKQVQRIKDAATRLRFLVILHTAEGYSQSEIAEMLACCTKTVARVQQRFREHGVAGLWDRRGDNGTAKVTDDYILALIEDVRGSPQDHGYPEPSLPLHSGIDARSACVPGRQKPKTCSKATSCSMKPRTESRKAI